MTQLADVMPIGWISISKNNDWIRTGTLAGTHALVVRKNNGISYALVANSSTYSSGNFSSQMFEAIEKGIQSIKYWPPYNLFQSLEKEYVMLQRKKLNLVLPHKLYANLAATAPSNLLTKKD